MKVPIDWLQDYVKTSGGPKKIAVAFTQIGLMLDKPLDDSGVLDLEHRMDRSDWLSILGCARDLAAYQNLPLKEPALYNKIGLAPKKEDLISIEVKTPYVRRFNTVVIRDVHVQDSPNWLKKRLSDYGIDPVNNIVDITNYVMVELGQTLHAQDIAKLKGRDITIRPARKGEKITTLLGTEVDLDPGIFILTSGGIPTVIGGIVGGIVTGVTKSTTDIVLDAGNYDQKIIRRNSRKLKIVNESVSRNDKILNPHLCEIAIKRAVGLILELAGGKCYTNIDYYPKPVQPKSITLRYSRLELLAGMQVPVRDAKRILKSLGYVTVSETDSHLELEIPYYRTDVEVEDDLVADILRIGDYSNIPTSPLTTPVPLDITPDILLFEDKLRNQLVAQGAHEHITSSLVKSDSTTNQVVLANSLSEDQNALRDSLLPSLRQILRIYPKHKLVAPPLFELGKVFSLQKEGYQETHQLSVVSAGSVGNSLATLLHNLGIDSYQITDSGGITVGSSRVGEISDNAYTLDTATLLKLQSSYSGVVSDYRHETSLDISLVVPEGVSYYEISQIAHSLRSHWSHITCLTASDLGKGQRNYLLQITWPAQSKSIQSDKEELLKELAKHSITSKS